MIAAKEFWDWFIINNNKFFFLNQIEDDSVKENILSTFLEKLHEFSDGLFFEIGGYPDEDQELIITAEGNKAYFPKVIELVNESPKIKNWKIIAFKQPQNIDFITRHNEIKLDPKKIVFSPLENPNNPEAIGIKVLISDFDPLYKYDYPFAVKIVLDNILGEQAHAENIVHIEVCPLSNKHESEFIDLLELPNYIKWLKTKTKN